MCPPPYYPATMDLAMASQALSTICLNHMLLMWSPWSDWGKQAIYSLCVAVFANYWKEHKKVNKNQMLSFLRVKHFTALSHRKYNIYFEKKNWGCTGDIQHIRVKLLQHVRFKIAQAVESCDIISLIVLPGKSAAHLISVNCCFLVTSPCSWWWGLK